MRSIGGFLVFMLAMAHVTIVAPIGVRASGTPVSLTTLDTAYTQDFDTLANTGTSSTVPTGWAFSESGTNANTTYTAGTGSGTAGDTYSFGAASATDRAFGGLQSGSLIPTVGACFTNSTGGTVTSLDIAYTGEEWRLGTAARADRLDFQYSLDATSLTTGTWVDVDTLDYATTDTTGTAGARDGNNATFRTAKSGSISSLSIANGATFFIRWNDFGASGADDGLAVDDFSLTPHGMPNDTPTLSLSVAPPTFSEAAGTNVATGTVTRTNDPGMNASDLVVTIANPDTSELSVPTMVTIPATQSMVTFQVDAVDDMTIDGSQIVTLTASAMGFTSGTANVTVTDNDVLLDLISAVQGDVTVLASPLNNSPKAGMSVTVQGVVTNIAPNGFYVQEEKADDDGNVNTSEGIFVFTSTSPTASLGQIVRVSGLVSEFKPGGAPNLPITEITGPQISLQGTIADTGTPGIDIADLDAAVNIRTLNDLPGTLIYNSANPNDPNTGTEFNETIEGMLVRVTTGVVVAPTTTNGEFTVVAPGDATAGSGYFPTSHNLIIQQNDPPYNNPANPPTIGGGDFNPERIIVDDKGGLVTEPMVAADGDVVNDIVGTMDFSFGHPKLQPVFSLTNVVQASQTDPLTPQGANLRIIGFNVENLFDTVNEPNRADSPILTPTELDIKLTKLTLALTGPLALPDIIVCDEVENETVLAQLATRVNMATGTTNYVVRSLDAADDRGIEVAFLYNTNRVTLQSPFVPGSLLTPPGNPGSGTTVGDDSHTRSFPVGPFANVNLGTSFIADTDDVFEGGPGAPFSDSREPLVGVFRFNGNDVLVIGVHLASKGGDGPLYGDQPVVRGSEAQRKLQGEYVRDLVDLFLTGDAGRNIPAFDKILVAGDFNDFQFPEEGEVGMDAVTRIQGLGVQPSRFLHNMMNDVPADQRYSFVFDGNSQAIDQMLVSPALLAARVAQDVAHLNADYPGALASDNTTFLRSGDHDIVAGTFNLAVPNTPPTANAGTDQNVNECTLVLLNGGASSDPDGPSPLTYAWSQTAGPTVTLYNPTTATPAFEAPNLASTTTFTFQLTVSDGAAMVSDTVDVMVNHVAGAHFDTVGVHTTGGNTFFLRNCNGPGVADVTTTFGTGTMIPLRGDWDNDGIDTVGAYDPASGCFFLKNTNTPGPADTIVCFGAPGATPLVGDWDGNGTVTVGIYNAPTSTFFLKNTNAPGPADLMFTFGTPGVLALVGDWDGNGTQTIGIYASSTGTFFLRNTNTPGAADLTFSFGAPGMRPVVGNWDGIMGDTVGVFSVVNHTYFLRNSNTTGVADIAFQFGGGGNALGPITGNWDGF